VTAARRLRRGKVDPRTGLRPVSGDGVTWFHYPSAEANPPDRVPEGMILVHNRVLHGDVTTHGTNGFRFWYQDPGPRRERCGCGWAPGAAEHYRVVME
jgi:hypothetical protein